MALTSTVKAKTKKSSSKVTPKGELLGSTHKVKPLSSSKDKRREKKDLKEDLIKEPKGKAKQISSPNPPKLIDNDGKRKSRTTTDKLEITQPKKKTSFEETISTKPSESPSRKKVISKSKALDPSKPASAGTAAGGKSKSAAKVTESQKEAEAEDAPSIDTSPGKQDLKSKISSKTKVPEAPSKKSKQSSSGISDKVTGVLQTEQDNDEEILLHGFSSESDSSDEDEDFDETAIDLGKLPTVAKDDATVKSKLEKAKRVQTEERGVLYLGRIPHGFYEDEMKAYFSQFGEVTRLRISRNKKTGRSKHYGFLEFASLAVAEIVAETMDNYLLMGHIMRCKLIPKDEIHPELWIGSNRKFKRVPYDRITRLQHNRTRTDDEQKKAEERLLQRQEQKKRKLKAAGIDYDFDAVAYKKPKAVLEG